MTKVPPPLLFAITLPYVYGYWVGMTGFKLMVTLQSGCVPEILTLCRIHKIFFEKYHEKAFIQSFPTMYNTMGSKVDSLTERRPFLQKENSVRSAIYEAVNPDSMISEQGET